MTVTLTDTTQPPRKKKSLIPLLFLIIIIGAVVGGGIYIARSVLGGEKPAPSPSPTPTSTLFTPSPLEEPEAVDVSQYSVQILNGSGVAGEAGKVNDLLVSAGFSKADTGNADNYDYTDSQIQLKANTPDAVFDAVKGALSEEYTIVKSSDNLAEDSEYDIVIIVGDRAKSASGEESETETPDEPSEEATDSGTAQ